MRRLGAGAEPARDGTAAVSAFANPHAGDAGDAIADGAFVADLIPAAGPSTDAADGLSARSAAGSVTATEHAGRANDTAGADTTGGRSITRRRRRRRRRARLAHGAVVAIGRPAAIDDVPGRRC